MNLLEHVAVHRAFLCNDRARRGELPGTETEPAVLTLDVWEFNSDSDAKAAYETLTAVEKQNSPREFDQTRANELRYKVIRATGIAGEIFTVKKVLFRILGENTATIQEYLIASKLARLR